MTMLVKNNELHLKFILIDKGFVQFTWKIRSCENGLKMEASACLKLYKRCGCNSVVECKLPKLDVAGSNPVARFGTIEGVLSKIWQSCA